MKLKSLVAGCSAIAMVTAFSLIAHADVIDPANITYTIDVDTPAYTIGAPGNGAPDNSDVLTDGIVASNPPKNYGGPSNNEEWVEFAQDQRDPFTGPIILHVDLGAKYDLGSLTLHYYRGKKGNRGSDPAGLQLSFSDDGATFGPQVDLDPFNPSADEGAGFGTADLTGYSGRYINVGIVMDPHDPMANNNQAWLFATELTFTSAPVPEPATLGLLGLGGVILTGRRKRRASGV